MSSNSSYLNNYVYLEFDEEESTPLYSNRTFRELICEDNKDCFVNLHKNCDFPFDKKAYKHQEEVFMTLKEGESVILTAGTNSGKTESWLSYLIYKNYVRGELFRALVIYPTVALSNDQYERFLKYGEFCFNCENNFVFAYYGSDTDIEQNEINAKIILSNPEKLASNIHKIDKLKDLFQNVGLIVIDEFDFHNTLNANMLLVLLKVLKKHLQQNLQFVIMSATLRSNNLKNTILDELTAHKVRVIQGRASKPKNKIRVILGHVNELPSKDPKNILLEIQASVLGVENLQYGITKNADFSLPKIKDAITKLKNEHFINDILLHFIKDNNMTIVFTDSIKDADTLYSKLREYAKNMNNISDLIVRHHSKMSEEEKSMAEDKIKENKARIVITVYTLSQGINVPNIVRAVYYGFPSEIRTFLQREGRKGRDPNIPYTESIIIPKSIYDLSLFDPLDPKKSYESWKELGPETIIILPPYDSFITLMEKLFEDLSSQNEKKSDQELIARLNEYRSYKLVSRPRNSDVYVGHFYSKTDSQNTYKIIFDGIELKREQVNHMTLLNYYQVGSIDYYTKGVVIKIDNEKLIVKEKSLEKLLKEESVENKIEKKIKELINSYIKKRYGGFLGSNIENWINKIMDDISSLRLFSQVEFSASLYKRINNSNLYIVKIIPQGVNWYFVDDNGNVKKIGHIKVPSGEKKPIYTLTYGYEVSFNVLNTYIPIFREIKSFEEIHRVLINAINLINLILRLYYGIHFPLVKIFVKSNDKNLQSVIIWEDELHGVLETLIFNNSLEIQRNGKALQLNKNYLYALIRNFKLDNFSKLFLRSQRIMINENELDILKELAIDLLEAFSSSYAQNRNNNNLNFHENSVHMTQNITTSTESSGNICFLLSENWDNLLSTYLTTINNVKSLEITDKNIVNQSPGESRKKLKEYLVDLYKRKDNKIYFILANRKGGSKYFVYGLGETSNKDDIIIQEERDNIKVEKLKFNLTCINKFPIKSDEFYFDINYDGFLICGNTNTSTQLHVANLEKAKKLIHNATTQRSCILPYEIITMLNSDDFVNANSFIEFTKLKDNIKNTNLSALENIILINVSDMYVLFPNKDGKFLFLKVPNECKSVKIEDVVQCMGLQSIVIENYLNKELMNRSNVEKNVIGNELKLVANKDINLILEELYNSGLFAHYVLKRVDLKQFIAIANDYKAAWEYLKNRRDLNTIKDVLDFANLIDKFTRQLNTSIFDSMVKTIENSFKININDLGIDSNNFNLKNIIDYIYNKIKEIRDTAKIKEIMNDIVNALKALETNTTHIIGNNTVVTASGVWLDKNKLLLLSGDSLLKITNLAYSVEEEYKISTQNTPLLVIFKK